MACHGFRHGTLQDMADSYASNPGSLMINEAKLRRLRPDLFLPTGRLRRALHRLDLVDDEYHDLAYHVGKGDCQPAVVVSTEPLRVAAYSDELDCVAMLGFPVELVREYALEVRDSLISVNLYWTWEHCGGVVVPDLYPGKGAHGRYGNFDPVIGDFVSDSVREIDQHKKRFSKYERARAWELGQKYLKKHSRQVRDGRPGLAVRPCPYR